VPLNANPTTRSAAPVCRKTYRGGPVFRAKHAGALLAKGR
jgi:hypothetical protein